MTRRRRCALQLALLTCSLAVVLLVGGCGGAGNAVSNPGPTPQPAASLSPGALNFPNTTVGVSTPSQPVSLQNNGSAALGINNISANGDYSVTHNCGSSLAPSAGCTINVTFTPSGTGTRAGTLQITDNAPNSPQSVTLSGMGIVSGLRTVTLNWTLSNPSNPQVIGYFAYHSTQSGGPYTLLNSVPLTSTTTSFQDQVAAGQDWYFVVTAVDANMVESVPSNEAHLPP